MYVCDIIFASCPLKDPADVLCVLPAQLYFTEMPDMDVYVRSYGGWMLSITSRLDAHLLTKELERVRASYNHSYHYGVGYDRCGKLFFLTLISNFIFIFRQFIHFID